VIILGHHHQDPLLAVVALQAPVHAPLSCQRREPVPKLFDDGRLTRRGELDPHEEVPRGPVAELLEVNDVALLLEQEVRDRLDDSQGIRAMEGQHKLPAGRAGLIRRGLALRRRLVRRRVSK
jgi:hypothetical protein